MVRSRRAARLATPVGLLAALTAVALASACGGGGNGGSAGSADASPGDVAAADVDAGPPMLETAPPEPVADKARRDVASSPVVFDRLRGGVWTANGDVGTVSY